MPPAFTLDAVTVDLGPARLLGPVTLNLEAGVTTALLGASGAGKSTLLRLLNGLLRPSQGAVLFGGAKLELARLPEQRRQMGYMVQGGGLFPHLTAGENIALVARWLGWSEARIAARQEALLGLGRLPAEALARYPGQLSGGQAQRVSLLRALMLDPEVLLLDEPLGALDPITRAELQEDLRETFARLRKTVVLVTHDLGEAAFLARRLVLLAGGLVVQEGALADLRDRPATPFVSQFLRAQRPPPELS